MHKKSSHVLDFFATVCFTKYLFLFPQLYLGNKSWHLARERQIGHGKGGKGTNKERRGHQTGLSVIYLLNICLESRIVACTDFLFSFFFYFCVLNVLPADLGEIQLRRPYYLIIKN